MARRKEWSATLKMASTRVMGTECMNGDNMKGYYMADGALFIYKSGEEYLNIFPVWDWRKIPGTTCYQDDAEVPVLKNSYYPGNSGKFVGGLTDEGCGVSVMHLDRDGLEARKLWLFTEDAIVCLGAGISSDSTLEVATTLEQCWSRGNLEELNNGKWTRIDGERNISGKEIRLIHDGKGYILRNPEGIRCEVSDMKSTGDWHEIMQTCPTEKVEGKVATICINHGIRPNDANYEAIIIPDADKKCVEKFDADKFYVIENNEKLQAIADKANGILRLHVNYRVLGVEEFSAQYKSSDITYYYGLGVFFHSYRLNGNILSAWGGMQPSAVNLVVDENSYNTKLDDQQTKHDQVYPVLSYEEYAADYSN